MKKEWPTRERDLIVAQQIIEEYANQSNTDALGLFELVVDQNKKKMNFRLSGWVINLAEHFKILYGADQGDFVTRQVITQCLTKGHTIH